MILENLNHNLGFNGFEILLSINSSSMTTIRQLSRVFFWTRLWHTSYDLQSLASSTSRPKSKIMYLRSHKPMVMSFRWTGFKYEVVWHQHEISDVFLITFQDIYIVIYTYLYPFL